MYLAIAPAHLGFWAPGLTELDLVSTWSTQYPNRVAALPNALVCAESWNLAMMTFISILHCPNSFYSQQCFWASTACTSN